MQPQRLPRLSLTYEPLTDRQRSSFRRKTKSFDMRVGVDSGVFVDGRSGVGGGGGGDGWGDGRACSGGHGDIGGHGEMRCSRLCSLF
jgi:hypothetical protein